MYFDIDLPPEEKNLLLEFTNKDVTEVGRKMKEVSSPQPR